MVGESSPSAMERLIIHFNHNIDGNIQQKGSQS